MKIKNFLIVFLSIAVILLGGFIFYDKFLNVKNENQSSNEEEFGQDNIKNVDAFVAKNYINDIIDLGVYNVLDRLDSNGLTEEMKLSMVISNMIPQNIYTCSAAFDVNLESEYRPTSNQKWGCYENDIVRTYRYDLVNEKYKKMFGNKDNAKKISVLETYVFDYSNKIDSYVGLEATFGPIVSNSYYYDIESANILDDKFEIEISYLTYWFSYLGSEEVKYTIDGNEYSAVNEDEISKVFDENRNLLPRLTFTYELDNGNYVLKSVD